MSIVRTIADLVPPETMAQIAKLIGAQPDTASKAMSAAVPAVLSGLLATLAGKGGADKFADLLGRQQAPDAADPWALFASDAKKSANAGADVVSSLLGSRASALTSSLKGYAGLSDTAAHDLMGVAGAAVMGALGQTARDRGLDAAGLAHELLAEKDEIARAMPADFASKLEGTGLLDALSDRMDLVSTPAVAEVAPVAEAVAARTAPPRPAAPPPAPKGRPWWLWLVGLVIVAGLAWWLFGRSPAPPPPAPAPTPAAEPAPAPVAPAAPEQAAEAPVVDVGATLTAAVEQLSQTLSGITDAASAQAALPTLSDVSERLSGLTTVFEGLPEAARAEISETVGRVLPELQSAVAGLRDNEAIGGVLGQILDTIMQRLSALAG